ncbi:MAG: DUF934 domain-containing protein [Pseudoruegeria sp.]
MSVIVTDTGFGTDDWTADIIAVADLAANDASPAIAIDLNSDSDPSLLRERLADIDMIRIDFPSFADGRGFTIAKRLRQMGYSGRLRARGHVISDQYAMARRVGFDEVEINDDLAARQPESEWLFRANWKASDYQNRLRA